MFGKGLNQPENDGSDPTPSTRTENLAFRENVVKSRESQGWEKKKWFHDDKNSQAISHPF